ncbi:MAG: RluA family pseudouridine synthase [Bacteroidota bacterium]
MVKLKGVLYEDNHLLVVNKIPGILVQGDSTGDETLADVCKLYIKQKYNKPGDVFLGVVHRLDRPVSGAIVFARTSKALERLNRQFQNRAVKKTYWALVEKNPPENEGKLVHWLVKDTAKNRTSAHNKEVRGSKRAELDYRLLGRIGDSYLLEITPITGRPHQIRTQLARIGCPIKGDVKYGFQKRNKDGSIYLHSRAIAFEHPTKKENMTLVADLPEDDFWRNFKDLD